MSLQGDLQSSTVVDVLRLLEAAGKTGVVRFTGEQSGQLHSASLYFRDGKPVAAETGELAGEAALEALCAWDSGSFVYREGATTPRENLDRPVDELAALASSVKQEWQQIRQAMPEPSATVQPVSDLPPDVAAVEMDRDEWLLLARMTRSMPLSAWVQQGGGGLSAHRTLRKLVDSGLLKLEASSR